MRISDWSSDVCSSDLMARAVHRLDRIGALLGLREEHVLLVVVPVPGLLPQADVKDLRTAHRSEERRVGKECVSTCRSRWSPYNYKKKINVTTCVLHMKKIEDIKVKANNIK